MVYPIPNFVKNIWSKWNIRAVILTSLSLQIVLIFLAPFRKRTKNPLVTMMLWSTYLLADFTANFCVGLISNRYGDQDTSISNVNDFLLAFWAPFLLLHLGGPDTITAFSLEDNELWLRHMLGLIVQVCLTGYVFLLTVPANTLWIPTALVFVAGIIKYAERTRSLQLASISNFRQSMTRKPEPGPNYAKLMEEYKSRKDVGLPTKIITMPEPTVDVVDIENRSSKAAEREAINIKDKEANLDDMDAVRDADVGVPTKIVSMPEPTVDVGDIENQPSKVADGGAIIDKDKEENLDDMAVVRDAYRYFDTFKGLIIDMIFSFHERNESREYFLKQTPMNALRVIEVELNFIYEAFYTKASVVHSRLGYFFRFVAVSSIVAALVLFFIDKKHGCNEFDVKVTYMLLYGAVALDVVSLLMLVFSDHTFASFKTVDPPERKNRFSGIENFARCIFRNFLMLKKPKWQENPNMKGNILSRQALFRRWSGSISGFNLLLYTLRKRESWVDNIIDYIGATELVEQWMYEEKKKPLHRELLEQRMNEKKKPLLPELWIFIFRELERKSADADDVETIQRICSSRGAWVIQEGEILREDINKLMPYVDSNAVTFDQSLILWHIATDLLFYDDAIDKDVEHERDISKLLSDYMLYLLIMQPTMMSAIRGIGHIRFQDTCAEATKFFEKREVMKDKDQEKKLHESTKTEDKQQRKQKDACAKLIGVCTEIEPSSIKGDRSKSLLFNACRLANDLKNLKEKNKWKIIAQVWVELLSYAACNCRPITHVQQLRQGGEFISLVWLLMTHLGIVKQFQIKEGHARAKLIVGEETKSS